jgi:hypothetical protein
LSMARAPGGRPFDFAQGRPEQRRGTTMPSSAGKIKAQGLSHKKSQIPKPNPNSHVANRKSQTQKAQATVCDLGLAPWAL